MPKSESELTTNPARPAINPDVFYAPSIAGRTWPGSKYTVSDRINAVVTYLSTGNQARTASDTGIPAQTLSAWRKEDWWDDVTGEVRSEYDSELEANFVATLRSAQAQVIDRLENGDVRLVNRKDGVELVRVPVAAKDAHLVACQAFDKYRVLRNLPTSISGSADSGKLHALATQFAELSGQVNARTIAVQTGKEGQVTKDSGSNITDVDVSD